MSHRRAVLTSIVCAVVLLSASCTRSVSRQPQVSTPAPPATAGVVASQDKYPDTLEGLQSLMNDMLSATKRGDAKILDALVKRTEFADYERYFVSTYSPDPLAGEDWAITYRRWLKDNEDNLRELLGISPRTKVEKSSFAKRVMIPPEARVLNGQWCITRGNS